LIFTADEEAGSGLGARWIVDEYPDVLEGCQEAIGEVGGFSLTVRDDLRLYPIQTAEKGMAWINLIAEGRAGHGSLHHPENAITELSAAVARIGAYEWPRRITGPQRASSRQLPKLSKSILIRSISRRAFRDLASSRE
jgi:acetylornithine deacetylase/succinyl-diaminopimelate desuccinylase-like protein